ncbi:hypothetical protein ACXET9_09660 [Brachybacterium sp. DNPG3]
MMSTPGGPVSRSSASRGSASRGPAFRGPTSHGPSSRSPVSRGSALPPTEAVLLVGAAPEAVRTALMAVLQEDGWRIAEEQPDDRGDQGGRGDQGDRATDDAVDPPRALTLRIERGSLRRTVLLGALAGRAFHLTATITLRPGSGADASRTELVHRWGGRAGGSLGGVVGRATAVRRHEATAALIEQRLGRDLEVRRIR